MGQPFESHKISILLGSLAVFFSTQFAPLRGADPADQVVTAVVIKIETATRKQVTFTLKGTPKLEVVNNRLNVAVNSREGMLFEITGIPAKDGVSARRYRGPEFRAFLLHLPFQEEAASDDPFEDESMLQIRKTGAGEAGGVSVEIKYSGRMRAGAEILNVHFQFSGLLPEHRKFLKPTH